MISEGIRVNIVNNLIDRLLSEHDIRMKETYKSITNILISSVIYKDASIIIMSEAIHQIDRIIKKHDEKINFVSILLGFDCIRSIDKYGTVTIPLAFFLNKLTLNKEIISKSSDTLNKKILTNATQTLCISEMLSLIGIPKILSILVVNVLLELCNFKLDKEFKIMYDTNSVFKGYKMSDTKRILKNMEFEKIFISTGILILITHIGLSIGSSLILTSILDELIQLARVRYKETHLKTILSK